MRSASSVKWSILGNIIFYWKHLGTSHIDLQGYTSGGNWGGILSHSIEIVNFGEEYPPFLPAHYLERTYFRPFSIILVCTLCILLQWNLNILYIIYHLMHLVT